MFHFHALEKEMATHSSVLAWRIPGTGESGGLPSMGSHRVGDYWSDLTAARALKKKKKGGLLLAALGLRHCAQHSLAVAVGTALPHGAWASRCRGFTICGVPALERRLSNRGAYLTHGLWDLPRPGKGGTCVPCIGRWIFNH